MERQRLLPTGWVKQATAPSDVSVDYGLFWWRDNQWGLPVFAARGARGNASSWCPTGGP